MTLWRLAPLILCGLALAACARSVPAPVDYRVSQVIERVLRDDAARRVAQDQRRARREIGPGPIYTVRRGDSIGVIAERYGVSAVDIVRLNGISDPDRIYAGQALVLPASARVQVAGPARPQSIRPTVIVDESAIPRDAPTVAATPKSVPKTQTRQVASLGSPARDVTPTPRPLARAESPPTPTPAARPRARPSGSEFDWPVRGQVLQTFGPQGAGRINDGINIAASAGDPVFASAAGEVIYVGEEVKNLGSLLLIRHHDGWITAYAHTNGATVKTGQQVSQGEMIARAGRNGGGGSHVHFQLRRGTEPVDPLTRLPNLTS